MDGCISVLVRLFFSWSVSLFQNISCLSSVVFAYWCPFLTIFKFCNLYSHYVFFFKCIKLHQILFQFSTINLAQALDINSFEGDYPNLNNPIPSIDIILWYISKVYCREQGQHLMQQKRTCLAPHSLKKYPIQNFFLIQCQKSLLPPSVHFQ